MKYNTVAVEGLDIFYREDGDPGAPQLVLLHGYPASSHQYRNLIPALASRFHVVAPDYPGFGNSSVPDPREFPYTFDRLAEVTEALLAKIGFTRFGLYVQDYGGPVGLRLATRQPDCLEWLIIQNSNAYEVGFTAAWDGLRHAYWKERTPEVEQQLEAFMQPATIRQIYLHGHARPELVSPDNWNMDSALIARPNQRRIQLDLFYDYRTNVARYREWQDFLKKRQPKTIIFWGQNDLFFTREGGEAYLRDLPRAEMHRLDSGHFATEDCAPDIAQKMIAFHAREVS
jgi:pimeloyl-ACP methyl ester carboxylesterase